jgi:hypothetical protein
VVGIKNIIIIEDIFKLIVSIKDVPLDIGDTLLNTGQLLIIVDGGAHFRVVWEETGQVRGSLDFLEEIFGRGFN